jgi:8-oxo-dGTP diphosphatase
MTAVIRMKESFSYYAGQARYIGAAGVVLRDSGGLILLVKPTYKAVWHLPGGIIESDETPRVAACREVREEIGLDVTVGRLLSVDHKSANADRPAGVQFVFDGGVLSAAQVESLRLDPDEIEAWQFVTLADVAGLVEPGGPAARMTNTLAALRDGRTVYLEDGEIR